jgi:Tol biopolymer transport system component
MSQLKAARPTPFLIALLAVIATACSDLGGPPAGEPEQPGVLLVTLTQGGDNLAWTSDGTELVYAVAGHLNAVSASTHTVRQLDTPPSVFIEALSRAGERIYVASDISAAGPNDPNSLVSRVNPSAGSAEILVTNRSSADRFMRVSSDERFLVSQGILYDLQAGAQITLPVGRPFGFSPDGTQLLYYQFQDGVNLGSPRLISTADGSSSQELRSTAGSFYYGHRWEGNSPQLLDSERDNDGLRLFEIDGMTGARRDLAQFGSNPMFPTIVPVATWSPDGRTLAIWIEQGSGAGRRSNLYVIRSGSAPAVVASVITGLDTGVGFPVFSPSGNSVAYPYYLGGGTSLYMKSGI